MSEPPIRFDPESARESWDIAADAYAEGQAAGRDFYRYEFFGPAQVELCGPVDGKRILDVGCGNGYFAREMARRGAKVTGIDISPRMIRHAERFQAHEPLGIDYQILDATAIASCFPAGSFDMATACVALQDMPDIPAVIRGIYAILRPEGRLVSSITHPCTDTPYRVWEKDEAGRKLSLRIDRYYERKPLEFTWGSNWPYEFKTAYWHVPLEDWIDWILGAGFRFRALREPCPTPEALASRPDLEDAARVPYFLLFDLLRPR